MTAPLAGIRVIEAATWLAAPSAAALLADLGADVIKIEPPGGDPWRHFDPSSMGFDEPSAIQYGFEFDNRGKALDRHRPAAGRRAGAGAAASARTPTSSSPT